MLPKKTLPFLAPTLFAVVLSVTQSATAFIGLADILVASQIGTPSKLRLCYMSLNNEKEFGMTKDFVDRVQKLAGRNFIEVQEFQKVGERPEKTLEDLITSNTRCDALVISGHHTGAFGGGRASGSLSIEYMERSSCKDDRQAWFSKVNSLWLQGCRTLGAPSEVGRDDTNLAEFHANRVNAVRNEDGLEQNQMDLAREFSDLLDTQTPYATRFMKTFPQARLFGWTRTAPGEKAESERSLPFHIHNVAVRMLAPGARNPLTNPFAAKMSADQARIYLDALIGLMIPPKSVKSLQASLTAWNDHGKPDVALGTVGFTNPELASMPPLFRTDDPIVRNSRKFECNLRNAKTKPDISTALDQILKDQRVIALTYYTLKDVTSRQHSEDTSHISTIVEKMRGNRNLMTFLENKISSRHSSLVRKVETAGFLSQLGAKPNDAVIAKLRSEIEGALLVPIPEGNSYDQLDYKSQLLSAAINNKLISTADLGGLLNRATDHSVAQGFLRNLNSDSPLTRAQISSLVVTISQSRFAKSVGSDLGNALSNLKFWTPAFDRVVVELFEATKPNTTGYIPSVFATLGNLEISQTSASFLEPEYLALFDRGAAKGETTANYVPQFIVNPKISIASRTRVAAAYMAASEKITDKTQRASRASEWLELLNGDRGAQLPPAAKSAAKEFLVASEATILAGESPWQKADLLAYYVADKSLHARANAILLNFLKTPALSAEVLSSFTQKVSYEDALTDLSFLPKSLAAWLISSSTDAQDSYTVFQYLNKARVNEAQLLGAIRSLEARFGTHEEFQTAKVMAIAKMHSVPLAKRRELVSVALSKLRNAEYRAVLPAYISNMVPGLIPSATQTLRTYLQQNPDSALAVGILAQTIAVSSAPIASKKAQLTPLLAQINDESYFILVPDGDVKIEPTLWLWMMDRTVRTGRISEEQLREMATARYIGMNPAQAAEMQKIIQSKFGG